MSYIYEGSVAFPNALMLLIAEDYKQAEIPDIDGIANFWSTASVWAQAVQHVAEGDVLLRIGKNPPDDPALALLHQGVLHSSRRLVDIHTVYLDSIARFRTRSRDVPISIWGDDARQPERVVVQCQGIAEGVQHGR
ncbi:hypothetical protein NKCBBBOE_01007 [Pseudarthrobacter sp. MM222]|nr:hypothetical protein NKCBBBOE_01007 [Pseudarthrobacter sp. MM222]